MFRWLCASPSPHQPGIKATKIFTNFATRTVDNMLTEFFGVTPSALPEGFDQLTIA